MKRSTVCVIRATQAVLEHNDVIVVASVSCIYGLGSPEDYRDTVLVLRRGESQDRDGVLRRLVEMYFSRNPVTLSRGEFSLKGEVLEVFPIDSETAVRATFWGDEIESLVQFDPVTGEVLKNLQMTVIYPAKHFVTPWPQTGESL